ncbi:MAG: hypothetical protein ACN6PJ_16610 [Achromobacter sp.]|uniref:hypothetical protein n=1 Tax=Achromobacter sp. TaxID=134375 RepID=UPI003D028C20
MFENNIYAKWGFTESPFSSKPLLPNKVGESILVGRNAEMQALASRMVNSAAAACLDGPIGAGKTSLANIVVYKGFQNHLEKRGCSPLLIPCGKTFQIKEDESAEEFKLQILLEVAQALSDGAAKLQNHIKASDSAALEAWLSDPILMKLGQNAASILRSETGISQGDTHGMSKIAFESYLKKWLERIFPGGESGGVVCIIDNLELLEKSSDARRKIENLRDTLFNMPGIKWIFCGAHGILQGVVTSQRLAGYLQEPLSIMPLRLTDAGEIFKRRIEVFRSPDGNSTYLPLTAEDFHTLYVTLHQNLRTTLSHVEDYCLHVFQHGLRPIADNEKRDSFFSWMQARAKSISVAIKPHAGGKALSLFYAVASDAEMKGEFSPGDFEKFGFKSVEAFRPHVRTLEECGLVVAQKDDIDQRRKSISITGKGWLLHWYKTTQPS